MHVKIKTNMRHKSERSINIKLSSVTRGSPSLPPPRISIRLARLLPLCRLSWSDISDSNIMDILLKILLLDPTRLIFWNHWPNPTQSNPWKDPTHLNSTQFYWHTYGSRTAKRNTVHKNKSNDQSEWNKKKNNKTNNKNSSITESLAMYNHITIQCREVFKIYIH